LVVDVHALQPVDFLNLVDEVLLQFLFTEHIQNVVRVARTVHEGLASLDFLALLRSEEHTSELQSLTNLVCRLLLEKKKTTLPPSYASCSAVATPRHNEGQPTSATHTLTSTSPAPATDP